MHWGLRGYKPPGASGSSAGARNPTATYCIHTVNLHQRLMRYDVVGCRAATLRGCGRRRGGLVTSVGAAGFDCGNPR
jgi:hypothetical protein